MKKITFPLMAAAFLFAASCSSPNTDSAEVSDSVEVQDANEGEIVALDNEASTVEWIGEKIIGSKHNGTINIKSGEFILQENNLVGGNFVIDMHSINPVDQDEEDNAKLKAHLSSDDFFNVEEYPEAYFSITSVQALNEEEAAELEMKNATHKISGNLKVRDVEKNITIPAAITITDTDVQANTVFNMIRTDFNVMFASDENDPKLKDNLIKKEIHLEIHLEANR